MARPGETPGSARPVEAVPPAPDEDPTWNRLEDQLRWYSTTSRKNQRSYKWLKLLEIAIAASLPVVAAVHSPVWVEGAISRENVKWIASSQQTPSIPSPDH